MCVNKGIRSSNETARERTVAKTRVFLALFSLSAIARSYAISLLLTLPLTQMWVFWKSPLISLLLLAIFIDCLENQQYFEISEIRCDVQGNLRSKSSLSLLLKWSTWLSEWRNLNEAIVSKFQWTIKYTYSSPPSCILTPISSDCSLCQ